ncbi:MAG: LPS-assembly protein LptD [Gammaproteobacteria bacterium]|nr:LPS-assembly protein LptD [Gammaproteobacteria bacterium]
MFKKIIILAVLTALTNTAAALSSSQSNKPSSNPEYWWLCPIDRSLPLRPEFSALDTALGSMEVRAGQSRVIERDVTDFDDTVEWVDADHALRADHVSYNQPLDTLRAFGDVLLWQDNLLWRGQRITLNRASETYVLDRGRYWLLDSPGRGSANSIQNNRRSQVSLLERATYTTCPVRHEAWQFSASKLKLDHAAERGYATHALLKIYSVPIFYFPFMSFPLTDTRKSGFLIPTIGYTNDEGFDSKIPYYFNLAPNQDATLSPEWLSQRGLMMGGQYRYLGQEFHSEVDFSYLPNDRLSDDEDRYFASLKHAQTFDEGRGHLNALLQNVSDPRYFEDFGGSLGSSSQRFLDRRIDATYLGHSLAVNAVVQSYQNVDDTIPEAYGPYKRLPQIIAQTVYPEYNLRPHFQMLSDLAYFERADTVSGGRIGLEPSVSLPYIKPWLLLRPLVGVRRTDYFLSDTGGADATDARMAPLLSVDAQLFAERRFELGNLPVLQTLEPRAFYLLVPNVDQDDLPIFDSGLYDFAFNMLFLENRFSGRDRIGDANQLALAVTSRFLNLETGREFLRTSLGQIYYFRERAVTLPDVPVEDYVPSELVAEVASSPAPNWTARATLQWNPTINQTEKAALTLRYAPPDGTLVNAAYRLRGNVNGLITNSVSGQNQTIEQTDLSFRLPFTENLSLIGRWSYSLEGEDSLEFVGGVEVDTCCWGIRVFSRRYIRNVEGDYENAVFMQAELKGLGGLGSSASSFLRRNLPGYEPLF